MGSHVANHALFEIGDAVRNRDSRWSRRNDETGHAIRCLQASDDVLFGRRIEGARRVVDEEEVWVLVQGPRERNSLTLTAAQRHSSFTDHG